MSGNALRVTRGVLKSIDLLAERGGPIVRVGVLVVLSERGTPEE
jgi:hypothetical protein